jgi:hypothetical protein
MRETVFPPAGHEEICGNAKRMIFFRKNALVMKKKRMFAVLESTFGSVIFTLEMSCL